MLIVFQSLHAVAIGSLVVDILFLGRHVWK